MLYTVECTYTDRESEDEWNNFYSLEKLPALLSVSGFSTSQRFKALSPGCPVYLAIHTIRDANVISSEEYRQKGGGNFSRWQPFITDWQRNLYECNEQAPAVSANDILLLSPTPLDFLETERGYRAWEMLAAGLDKCPARRIAYVLSRETLGLLSEITKGHCYEPITTQLQNPTHLDA